MSGKNPTDILESFKQDAPLIPENIKEWWLNYLEMHRGKFLTAVSIISKEPGKMLEVGCTPGHQIVLLKEMGYDICGVDLAPSRIDKFLKKYSVDVAKVDIEKEPLPFDDESFDFLVLTDVIEHLRIDPLHAMTEAGRVLKPGGRFLLSTNNISPADRFSFLFGKDYQPDPIEQFQKLSNIGHMGHVRFYSYKALCSFLETIGVKPVLKKYGGPVRGGWAQKAAVVLYPWRDIFKDHIYLLGRKES